MYKTDYCVGYRCNEKKGWEVGFHGCICPDETILNEMVGQVQNSKLQNSKQFHNETLCCKSTLFTQKTVENAKIKLTWSISFLLLYIVFLRMFNNYDFFYINYNVL